MKQKITNDISEILAALATLGTLSIWCVVSAYAITYTSHMVIEFGTRADVILSLLTSFTITVINVFILIVSILSVSKTAILSYKEKH